MGLLEKALEYKREMNRQGKETIMDKIAGPADTEFVQEPSAVKGAGNQDLSVEKIASINNASLQEDDLIKLDPSELVAVSEKELAGNADIKLGTIMQHKPAEKDRPSFAVDDKKEKIAPSQPIYDELEPEDLVILEDDTEPYSHEQSIDKNEIIDELDDDDIEIIDEPSGEIALVIDEAEDDDLFDLPDDLDESIDDTLNDQRKDVLSPGTEYKPSKSEHHNKVEDPLGSDDVPVIGPVAVPSPIQEDDLLLEEAIDDQINNQDFVELEEKILAPSLHKFQDFMILYESGREILKADSKEELFDTILFSIMGQLGVSSSSILVPGPDDRNKWIIIESRGVTIADHGLFFSLEDGILGDIVNRKEAVDLEEYRDRPGFRDDYYKYISIDARIAIPLVYDEEVVGVVFLGEKLSAEDYSDEDKDFVFSIGEFAAIALRTILFKGKNFAELDSLEKNVEYINQIDQVREKIISEIGIDKAEDIIRDEFSSISVEIFSIFLKEEKDKYVPLITEKEDYLSLQNKLKISSNNYFINFILESEIPVNANLKNPILAEVFSRDQLSRMAMCRVYPFKIGRSFLGFIIINKVADMSRMKEIDIKLKRFADIIFPYLLNIKNIESAKNKYIDNVDHVFKRIDNELSNARSLNIPLTLVLFSIKNYKRYYHLYGYGEVKKLIESFEKVIVAKLSDGDFSVRYDRHKIIVVLPGKDRKYAVPFASSVCNEITGYYKKPEMQLLVTYLTAEFPEDGEDLYSLIDAVD